MIYPLNKHFLSVFICWTLGPYQSGRHSLSFWSLESSREDQSQTKKLHKWLIIIIICATKEKCRMHENLSWGWLTYGFQWGETASSRSAFWRKQYLSWDSWDDELSTWWQSRENLWLLCPHQVGQSWTRETIKMVTWNLGALGRHIPMWEVCFKTGSVVGLWEYRLLLPPQIILSPKLWNGGLERLWGTT